MGMSPVVQWLLTRYKNSRAGHSGTGKRDILVAYNQLLKEAGCPHGEARDLAESELKRLAALVVYQRMQLQQFAEQESRLIFNY